MLVELSPQLTTAVCVCPTVGSVKVAVHRLRRRYRELLRDEIGRTVEDPAEIEAEIQDLFAALG